MGSVKPQMKGSTLSSLLDTTVELLVEGHLWTFPTTWR